eukprot:UN0140
MIKQQILHLINKTLSTFPSLFSVDRCSAIIYVFHACLCVLYTVASQVPGTQDRAGLIASSGSFFSMVSFFLLLDASSPSIRSVS